MQRNVIEARVLQILECVEKKVPVEDDRVELKREWIEAKDAARQIAGHANTMRGEPILWVFGADEKAGTVPGVALAEVSSWYSQLKSCFDDGIAPDLTGHVNVNWNSASGNVATVAALHFVTDQSPYVVKNPGGGAFSHEVPWRQGVATYSARRTQLLRLLAPLQKLPSVELLRASLEVKHNEHKDVLYRSGALEWRLDVDLYFLPPTSQPIVIPKWETLASFDIQGMMANTTFPLLQYDRKHGSLVEYGSLDLRFNAPGIASLRFNAYTSPMEAPSKGQAANLTIKLLPLDAYRPVKVSSVLQPSNTPKLGGFNAWEYRMTKNGINLLLE